MTLHRITVYARNGGFSGPAENFLHQAARAWHRQGIEVFAVFEKLAADAEAYTGIFSQVSCSWMDFCWFAQDSDAVFFQALPHAEKLKDFPHDIPTVVSVHDRQMLCFRGTGRLPLLNRECPFPAGKYCCFCGGAGSQSNSWPDFSGKLDFLRKADLVLAPSNAMLRLLCKSGVPPRKLHKMIPFFMPNEALNPNLELQKSDGEIICPGPVEDVKHAELLFRALRLLQSPRWHLHVANAGNSAPELRDLVQKLGIESHVSLGGSSRELDRYCRNAILTVILPGSGGLQEQSALYAMAYALPAVAAGMRPEWLQDRVNGIAAAQNAESLAGAIDELLCNRREAVILGNNARRKVLRYTGENFTARFQTMLERAIRRRMKEQAQSQCREP